MRHDYYDSNEWGTKPREESEREADALKWFLCRISRRNILAQTGVMTSVVTELASGEIDITSPFQQLDF